MVGDPEQLAALAAVVQHGTFEAAARALHVTPSAVSQRIRALEDSTGQVVVQRTKPCRATPSGEVLLRLAQQIELASAEAEAALHPGEGGHRARLAVAVNADSLVWFRPLLAVVAGWGDVVLELFVEDQDHSAELLRSGTVMAAVTASPDAVQGCSVQPLGVMRYLPVAAPGFARQWFPTGTRHAALRRAPMVQYNDKDRLQLKVMSALDPGGGDPTALPPVHRVPSLPDYLTAVRVGLGWGSAPEQHLEADLAQGTLIPLSRRLQVDVPLYWQRWRLTSRVLDRLTEAVVDAASQLRRPRTR